MSEDTPDTNPDTQPMSQPTPPTPTFGEALEDLIHTYAGKGISVAVMVGTLGIAHQSLMQRAVRKIEQTPRRSRRVRSTAPLSTPTP